LGGIIAAQRGGEEFQEGIECPLLVILIKGHEVRWVNSKASRGCRRVGQ
jgi:hypothetical protein